MASIISYIGRFCSYDKEDVPKNIHIWDAARSYGDNIVKYCLDDQLRIVLDHTLAIAYYESFYGKRCSDVVNEFVTEVVRDNTCRFIPKAAKEFAGSPRGKLVDVISSLTYFIKEGIWKNNIDVNLVREFMEVTPIEGAYPLTWIKRNKYNYIPYLMWKNKGTNSEKIEVNASDLGITGFKFSCYCGDSKKVCLAPDSYPIGTSFNTRNTPVSNSPVAILSYVSQFDLSTISVERLVGILGDLCFHFDIRRSGTSSTQVLAACIMSNVLRRGNISGARHGTGSITERFKPGAFAGVTALIEYMHQTYGTEIKSKEILGRLLFCIAETKEQKDSAQFIREQGGSASADHLASFNKVLGSLEALQFISQSTTLLSAQSQDTENGQSPSGNNKTDNDKSESTKDEGNKSKETEEAKKEEKPEEDDNTQDDLTSEDDTSEDRGSQPEGDVPKKDNPDNSDPSGEGTDAGGDDMPSTDEQINTSDDEGFEFKVVKPEGETTDSVMFREEMNNYLSSILANPPEDLSPQDVATLVALQRFWLYSLSIETIVGIVGSCVKQLPESLTKLITHCGVTNNE